MKDISSAETKQLLLELMDDIHQFCVNNQIKYSLAFGSLLGAIRHQGFIPWDDDIDLYMLREDYEKFRKLYKPMETHIQLNDCENNLKYHRTFLKVEDTRTIVHEISALDYLGISIDIFPVDNLFDDLKACSKLCNRVGFIRKLHMIKTMTVANNLSLYKKIVMCIGKVLLFPLSKHMLTMEMVNLFKKGEKDSKYVCILDMNHNKQLIFERTVYGNIILRSFEGREYYTMENADLWLKRRYGDYMKLPPIEERENGSCHEFAGTYFKDNYK